MGFRFVCCAALFAGCSSGNDGPSHARPGTDVVEEPSPVAAPSDVPSLAAAPSDVPSLAAAPSDRAPSPAAAPSDAPSVTLGSFAPLCTGSAAHAGGTAHKINPGLASPVLIYQRENGGEYARDSPSVFREWEAGDPSEVQLVACVATTFDDAVPVVERFEWTYEVRLLEAATGNELGRTTYAHTLQTDFDVGYEVPLLGLINDYQPADAPPLSSFDTASRIVCDGESVPGVDPFDPADRPHVHDVPMYWRTDAPVWSEVTGLWPEGEHSAQLVFCVRGTVTPNSKKSKTCRSRSPPGTMQVRSTRYAIELREVATGAILGQRVFLGDLRCPEVWKIRNPPLVYLAEVPFDAIVSWASRWVERG